MYTAIIAASASLLSPSQEAMTSVQYVPQLNLCADSIENENWKIFASDKHYEIHVLNMPASGRWRKPSFHITYRDSGETRYRLSLGMGHIPGPYLNHYVFADGELVHTAGHNERSNGNNRAIGLLTSDELAKMKSAKRVEIRITESSVLRPDRFYGSVAVDLRELTRMESFGRRLMEVVRKKKATTNCK